MQVAGRTSAATTGKPRQKALTHTSEQTPVVGNAGELTAFRWDMSKNNTDSKWHKGILEGDQSEKAP